MSPAWQVGVVLMEIVGAVVQLDLHRMTLQSLGGHSTVEG